MLELILNVFNKNRDVLLILIGGLLSILGGMISLWFQAKNARRIRMDEIVVERKIQTNNEA